MYSYEIQTISSSRLSFLVCFFFTQCNIASTVPICNNMNNQQLVDTWRAAGKKVILSFGGTGMGGSWSGDQNNCWDYCFGKEDELSTSLVNIIDSQNFDE